ncbi:phosphate ABC transporter permease subunit PstC [Pseudomonas seleniipraecipitans]|jgi:phosphate transport system permease protein|uniref:Phosphate transport system permease protein n=1 Tax=Phytopseudomonas seleniipraecipitans TaxID=640205 RepID=A0A1G7HVP1_9GAMM|nr:phosphate ABC transporter permease subunit PstC [Pseudomonas seleniipraecipitans]NQD78723.1 phosphate ABC transporter permease subunit PstC [Pseudomonas sp. CrR14]UUD63892.1 phosphate ABC transporter permease subunit PstC [Pseudomonas seleniipraecipitans]SDF04418.1 phosphate ABC transporter membrane protein 1, PhoT family [Pseudomonas seleniipraecipitans]
MTSPFVVPDNPDSACQPPSAKDMLVDRVFRAVARVGVILILAVVFALIFEVGRKALPGMQEHGFDVLLGSVWDVNQNKYGILPAIWGTLYSALIALVIAGFFGISMAIFLTQDFLPVRLAAVFRTIVELLAAIPSVVYGLWGIYVVIPAIRPLTTWLHSELSWIPFFGTSLSGPGLLPASLVLAIMILPTIAAVSQDALTSVPMKTKQAAYGMGTTHWEAILKVMVPSAATGIFGSLVLGLGRALGETMALAMLVGNANNISLSLFAPANTLAALLALNFPEAGPKEVEVLMYAALVLMLITLIVNIIGSMLMVYAQRGSK